MNDRLSSAEQRLAAWLEEGPTSGPDDVLVDAHARARSTRQTPTWWLRLRGRTTDSTWRARPWPGIGRLAIALLVTLLLAALLGGALIAGNRLLAGPMPVDPRPAADLIPQGDDALFAFTSGNRDGAPAELYVARADGTDVRRITQDTLDDSSPVWSPDGSRIAVISVDGDATVLRVIDADREPRTLAWYQGCADLPPPAWSPDGRFIAYVAAREGTLCNQGARDIWIVASDGPGGHPLLPRGQYWYATGPQWTRDRIVFSGLDRNSGLYVATVTDPSAPWGLTPTWIAGASDGATGYDRPRWSPDGASIAVTVHPPSASGFGIALRMGADGSDPAVIWPGSGDAILPDWSPDGTWLSVLVRHLDLAAETVYQLGIVPTDGSPWRLLDTPDLSGDGGPPRISPDGTRMLVRISEGALPGDVAVVTTDGQVKATLFSSGSAPVDWQPLVNPDNPAKDAPEGRPGA